MRVLLDTNIIIHRENKKVTNYSIGHLFRWIDKLKYEKVIHLYSISEIKKYSYADPQEAITLKLDAYNTLKTVKEPDASFLRLLNSPIKTENDIIDNYLLYEVYLGRVDLLITEDRKMIKKAEIAGIINKVYSINSFITYVSAEYPDLIDYEVLAVKKICFGEVDVDDPFFDSFRDSYDGFNRWFAKKCDEEAYICKSDADNILGFLYLKTEDETENYSDISPIFEKKRRLKVGTFKVESTGFRLGERFVKIIFDNALKRNVDEVYVTLFTGKDELIALTELLKRWGFIKYGIKVSNGNEELVFVKKMKQYDFSLTPKENYPNLVYNKQKFILPIFSQYHTSLFPDSILKNENEVNFIGKDAYKYALQKVYISFSYERNINSGDLIIFYRPGDTPGRKKYESVLTTVGIVDEIKYEFISKDDFLGCCQNRTVFTRDELESFWLKHKNSVVVVKFIFIKSFRNKLILEYLWDKGIVDPPYGPRPFTKLTDNQFDEIISDSQTDLSKYWRT